MKHAAGLADVSGHGSSIHVTMQTAMAGCLAWEADSGFAVLWLLPGAAVLGDMRMPPLQVSMVAQGQCCIAASLSMRAVTGESCVCTLDAGANPT